MASAVSQRWRARRARCSRVRLSLLDHALATPVSSVPEFGDASSVFRVARKTDAALVAYQAFHLDQCGFHRGLLERHRWRRGGTRCGGRSAVGTELDDLFPRSRQRVGEYQQQVTLLAAAQRRVDRLLLVRDDRDRRFRDALRDQRAGDDARHFVAVTAAQCVVAPAEIMVELARHSGRDLDEVLVAAAVAGKFDHYFCRRDDALRGRDGDEVPRIIASALIAKGVAETAITIIPDEQEAIDAALRSGEQGDLLLVFADALTRSWKQIIKFRPDGAAAAAAGPAAAPSVALEQAAMEPALIEMEGLIRDERGIRFARDTED